MRSGRHSPRRRRSPIYAFISIHHVSEIAGTPDLLQDPGILEIGLHGHGVGKLSGLNPASNRLINATVDRIGEVFWSQELRDALVGAVVCKQRAQKRLLGLNIRRRQTL